jgi:hypothetical protein
MNTECVSKRSKKVSFSAGTKEYDGQTEKSILFCKLVLDFFKGKIKNEFDVYKIIQKEQYLIFSLFTESLIILLKLNQIKKEEYMYSVIKPFLPLPSLYKTKNSEDFHLFLKWDTSRYNIAAYKKTNSPKAVGLVRQGSRIYSEKLTTVHIPHLVNFIKILFKTCNIVLKKNSLIE